MSDMDSLKTLQLPPKAAEADLEASREWQKTGFVPMEYVQSQLRQGLSSGQTIADLVRACMDLFPLHEEIANSEK